MKNRKIHFKIEARSFYFFIAFSFVCDRMRRKINFLFFCFCEEDDVIESNKAFF